MHKLVFVYGTLRQRQPNATLLQGAACLGRHITPPCYTLYALGDYPGVVARGRTAIVGEVYSVSRQQLSQLDRLEDYPRLYRRRLIPTPWGLAWIYLYRRTPDRRRIVKSGDWLKR